MTDHAPTPASVLHGLLRVQHPGPAVCRAIDFLRDAVADIDSAGLENPGSAEAGRVLGIEFERARAASILRALAPDSDYAERFEEITDQDAPDDVDVFLSGFHHARTKALAIVTNGAESWSGEPPGRAEPEQESPIDSNAWPEAL